MIIQSCVKVSAVIQGLVKGEYSLQVETVRRHSQFLEINLASKEDLAKYIRSFESTNIVTQVVYAKMLKNNKNLSLK